MRDRAFWYLGLTLCALLIPTAIVKTTEKMPPNTRPNVPKTWDDEAMATLEVPLADPVGSPKHVRADYYYKIPVRPIYKSYPVYAPGHEPPGYVDWLKQQEPLVIWD